MHHMLLNVIDELQPGSQAPVFSRQWRRHRLMVLRYVKALEPPTVADQLTISRRHYYREHTIVMEAIADIFWDRYVDSDEAVVTQAGDEATSDGNLELLRLEAARMAQASRYARVDDVIKGTRSLLKNVLQQHKLELDLKLPDALPNVAVDQNLLRQLLLGILGYLIEGSHQAMIQIMAHPGASNICLLIQVEPPDAFRPTSPTEAQAQRASFEEMASFSDVRFEPIQTDHSIVGFEISLPIAQRTVLVVDDNEDVLELIQRYLSAHHYQVVTAQSAQEARELARKIQPDAITLDLMIPDQDGWDLMQVFLNQPDTQHIPIIVCSVLKQKDLALSLGATAFLQKPVTEQALLSVLTALEKK
jgi:CheY-like chemotaxis protein